MSEKISLLYLCTGNSCRSQMAEGLTRALKGDQIEVYSAGVETHGLNPNAVKVMAEVGIDITTQTSKSIDAIALDGVGTVITLCADEVCPVFSPLMTIENRVEKLHWPFSDPAAVADDEQRLQAFRRVRDAIDEKLAEHFVQRTP